MKDIPFGFYDHIIEERFLHAREIYSGRVLARIYGPVVLKDLEELRELRRTVWEVKDVDLRISLDHPEAEAIRNAHDVSVHTCPNGRYDCVEVLIKVDDGKERDVMQYNRVIGALSRYTNQHQARECLFS